MPHQSQRALKPRKPQHQPQRSPGGYARKPPLRHVGPSETPPKGVPATPGRPVPPGLLEALQAKHTLTTHLGAKCPNEHLVVSVDVHPRENRWILVVRGIQPRFPQWQDHQVAFMPSKLVRNPRAARV